MKRFNQSLTDELKGIDKKIASLINQRSRVMCKVSQIRQHKSESLADVKLEKELWLVWKEELKKSNQSLVRQLYTLLNSLGYSLAEKSSSDKPFCLYPPTTPINLDISAPRCIHQSQYHAYLCALSPEKQEIPNFLINDNIIEIIKLANQCGAKLSWNENILTGQGTPRPVMDGQNLFINHSLFNFYLFLCLGLGSANRVKFNSSSLLKAVSLKQIQDFLPQLGARLYSIEPLSYSLPARLEASGQLPSEIYLPDNFDPMFVKALVLSAPTYEKSISIKYQGLGHQSFADIFAIMKDTGIKMEVEQGQVVIHPSKPCISSSEIPVDPVLSGFLLAMAGLGHGKITLTGIWPRKSETGKRVVELLKQCGIHVNIGQKSITAAPGEGTANPFFDFSETPDLVPLAFPLALGTCRAEQIDFMLSPELENYDIITRILNHIGYNFSAHSKGIKISSNQMTPDKNTPWNSPHAFWTLGYSLLSFRHKGICLANPGNITSLWPGFWKIFTNLSEKKSESNDLKGDIHAKPARKRIRL
ncbi:MAG: hypothetical protein ACLFP9_04575 [Desulfonatronovibrio sp.]